MDPRVYSKVIAEWRGYNEPPSRDRNVRAAAQLVEQLMADWKLTDQLAEQDILRGWREAVGEFVAAHSNPVRLRKGELTIRALQPSVRYDLERNLKGELLRRLQQQFGRDKIRQLRFVTG